MSYGSRREQIIWSKPSFDFRIARELKDELIELYSREPKEYIKTKISGSNVEETQTIEPYMNDCTISVTHSNKDDHCILYHFVATKKKDYQHKQK